MLFYAKEVVVISDFSSLLSTEFLHLKVEREKSYNEMCSTFKSQRTNHKADCTQKNLHV